LVRWSFGAVSVADLRSNAALANLIGPRLAERSAARGRGLVDIFAVSFADLRSIAAHASAKRLAARGRGLVDTDGV
jgi:hypothetical protein